MAVRCSRPDWERAASNTGLDGRRQGTDRHCGTRAGSCVIWTGWPPGKCSSSDIDRDRRRNGPFMARGGQSAPLGLRAFVQRNAPLSWPSWSACPRAGCGGWSHWLSSRVPLVYSCRRAGREASYHEKPEGCSCHFSAVMCSSRRSTWGDCFLRQYISPKGQAGGSRSLSAYTSKARIQSRSESEKQYGSLSSMLSGKCSWYG